ncbi:MAG: hypothetical protein ACRD8Z_22325 [Nitrososphaeraceae archaeon]
MTILPVPGTVIVPFPMKDTIACVSFIGVSPVFINFSSQIGFDENSNPDVTRT